MFKRPLCEMASGLILGILFMRYQKWYLAAVAAGILFGIVWNLWHNTIRNCSEKDSMANARAWMYPAFRVGCFLIFFLAGAFHYAQNESFRDAYMMKLQDGMNVTVQGKLCSKQLKNGQYSYYLDHCYLSIGQEILPCNQILFYQTSDDDSIGQTLIVTGTVELWKSASNDGNFDAKAFYESKKIDFQLKEAVVKNVYGAEDGFGEKIYRLRRKISGVYESCMSTSDAGVLSTMTLGEKNLLDAEVKQMYQKAGISHVLAISGLHISVIGMGLYKLLRKIKCSFLTSGVIAGTVIGGYGMMSGLGTSTIRAVLMFFVLLFGQWIGRSYDTLSALGLSAIVILLDNPYLLWYAGFLLSFAAVLGIVAVGQTLIKIKKPFFTFSENFLVSFAIQLATVPLTAYFFYEVSVWSMLINFFVLPIIGVLLFLGLLGGFVGLLSVRVAGILFVPCHWILVFYEKVCRFSARLPGAAWITGQPDWQKLLLFYVVLGAVLFATKKMKQRRGFVFIGCFMLLAVLHNPVKGFELDVLDVGQGDGMYLHTKEGTNFFFDGGSTDVSKVGTYRMLPFLKAKGVRKISCWFVSHTDTDHVSGLKEVLVSGYRVEYLVFAKAVEKEAKTKELAELARSHGTKVLYMQAGDTVRSKRAAMRCLYPKAADKAEDVNDLCLVLQFEEGDISALFGGDISTDVEEQLIRREKWDKVLIFKADHHGSRYANAEALLKCIRPEITVASAGKDNRYGHPSPDAVQRIKESGSSFFCTIEGGRIRVRVIENKLVCETYVK